MTEYAYPVPGIPKRTATARVFKVDMNSKLTIIFRLSPTTAY